MKLTILERMRRARDFIIIARAAHHELDQDFAGALRAISKARFRTNFGRVWGDIYRAKLLIITNQPLWHETVVAIARRVGVPEGARYDGYFNWYAQYLTALATCNEALEVNAVGQLAHQDSSRFIRRTLPYFPAPLVKT